MATQNFGLKRAARWPSRASSVETAPALVEVEEDLHQGALELPANSIDQFLSKVAAGGSTYMAMEELKEKLCKLPVLCKLSVAEMFPQAWLEAFLLEPPDPVDVQSLCDLLHPEFGVQIEASLALAEISADPTTKERTGQLCIPALLDILRTPTASEAVLAAATVAVGVLCRDCPANMCLLVRDEKKERAGPPRLMEGEGPPVFRGLQKLLVSESEGLCLAVAEVLMNVGNVFHVKKDLEVAYCIMVERRKTGLNKAEWPVERQMAVHAAWGIERICEDNSEVTSWIEILPHILVKQLLVDKTANVQNWGVALVVNRSGEGKAARAVRKACLSPLLELLNCSPHEQEKAALVLTQLAGMDSIRVQAIRMGALPALLKCLNVASKKHRSMKEAVAGAVEALMVGELTGEGEGEAAVARTEALPLLEEVVAVTQLDTVKDMLAATVHM